MYFTPEAEDEGVRGGVSQKLDINLVNTSTKSLEILKSN